MNGREFIKRVKRIGRSRGVSVHEDPQRGKGSHRTLYYGGRKTTVKKGEIGADLRSSMIKQVGLSSNDFR